MAITISGDERSALFRRIVISLTGIDDVYRSVEEKDWAEAQQLSQQFSALLWFVNNDLGWGEGSSGTLALTTPPDVLREAIGFLLKVASVDRLHHERDRDEASEDVEEVRQLQETCERILEAIERDGLRAPKR